MNVLLAVCGSIAIGPNIISMLRNISYINKIVGIDTNSDNPGKFLVDKFHQAPKTNDDEYIPFVLQLCEDENIDIILCTSTQNSLIPLKKNEELFNKINVKIPGTNIEDLLIANDKGLMLDKVNESGIDCPNFLIPDNDKHFDSFLSKNKNVIVKPRVSSGSRGFRILKNNYKLGYDDIVGKSDDLSKVVNANEYRNILKNEGNFSNILMMEYLEGQDYSVYSLANKGKSLVTIPFKRLNPKDGVSLVSEVDMNECVIDYVQKIVKLFNLDWVVNIQLKLSPDNKPLIYEINPRLAGSVILTKGANCDLLKYGLDVISNRELKINSPKSCKMIRYYTEVLV
jgi:carbamoyl-phosphate synthase large subunit